MPIYNLFTTNTKSTSQPQRPSAQSEYAYVITLSVESRESLVNQHYFKILKFSAAHLMLNYLQVFDQIFPGYLAFLSTLHMLVWWVAMQVHCHSQGEGLSHVANVVHWIIVKFAVFVGAYP